MAVYGAAALTAGYTEKDVPLEEVAPAIEIKAAQPDVEMWRPARRSRGGHEFGPRHPEVPSLLEMMP